MTDEAPDSSAMPNPQNPSQNEDDLNSSLAIIRISEPITSETEHDTENPNRALSTRGSDVSALDNPTPASLEADLAHYKVRS